MFAFSVCNHLTLSNPKVGETSFKTTLPGRHGSEGHHAVAKKGNISMAVNTYLNTLTRSPSVSVAPSQVPGNTVTNLINRNSSIADKYMAQSVRKQYLAISNATGIFGVQCTEGSVKHAAEVARVRSLGSEYRLRNSSTFKKCFDRFENRKNAIKGSHECHHEETQFSDFPLLAEAYNIGKSEATGSCMRYASPETVEEAAMLRYMDIQTKIKANPSGVYNTACNEGSVKDQAEDVRIAALNASFRQGQKPLRKRLYEKYEQKKQGFIAASTLYDESLIRRFPSLGACIRSKSYGF